MKTTTVDLPAIAVFDAADRCDRCGAQAHSELRTIPSLLFCIHHRKEYGDALLTSSFEVVDDAEAIESLTTIK